MCLLFDIPLPLSFAEIILNFVRIQGSRSQPATFCSYKRHLYYRQTAYSVMKWKAESNVRDATQWTSDKNGNPIHPTLFDVKGIGGGGYVVAPGSVRANGEVYAVIDDLPVIDVPDWLVDWLAKEVTKWKSDKQEEQQEHAAKFAALSKSERTALQEAGDASGFPYPASEIFPFMNWRAAISPATLSARKTLNANLSKNSTEISPAGKSSLRVKMVRQRFVAWSPVNGLAASSGEGLVRKRRPHWSID